MRVENNKTEEQLPQELTEMRRRVSAFEKAAAGAQYAESILDTVREPLLVLDADLRVVSANRSFCQTFQITPDEAENALVYDLGNRQWDIPRLRELLGEILPKSTTFDDFEVEHDFATIGRRAMLLNARRICRKANKTELILLAIEDITDRKRAEEALQKAHDGLETQVRERTASVTGALEALRAEVQLRTQTEHLLAQKVKELARSNAELEQFTHTVSHDLKSPLVTIQGFAGHVAQDAEQGRVDRLPGFASRITDAAGYMSQLIDDLLALSRAGRAASCSEHIAMTRLIRDIARKHEFELDRSHVALEVQDNMPTISADRARILQVFDNLLTNALKHGCDTREPRISIGARDEGNELRFFVQDNGPGIAAEHHGKIFELFARLPTSTHGTGVGLAIVKQAVAALEGRVWVESEPGQGATFWVAFPKKLIEIRDPVHS